MKTTLLLLGVCFLQTVSATTYYFSSASGDDSRSSSQAKSSTTPWKSLSKLNAVFSSLQPGDAVLLKRGETFYGSIIVNKSGTSGSPITIGAYGSGNKPIITSLVSLSGWVSKGSGIFESYNSALGSKLNMVLLNGQEQELGRYPNSNASSKGYLHYESVGTNSITDNNLTSSPNWTGAEVVIRSRRWILDRNLITSHSGTKISYNPSTSYSPSNNQGYFIQNSIKTLDRLGEWYYNASTKKLSVYFGSNSPSSYSVQAATADDLIHAEKVNYVVFDNLVIKGANASGIYLKYGSNVYATNCDIMFSGENGVTVYWQPNFKIENSTISNSNCTGINLGYNSGEKAIIRNNKITNTALFPGMIGSGDGKGLAIHSNGNSCTIEYNQIKKTGFSAISANGNYVTVKNNLIDSFCITKDDGAGIYSCGNSSTTTTGKKVIGNIILNGLGESAGTSWPSLIAEGIYMDNNTSNTDVSNNTIAGCNNQGVYIHSSYAINITNNTMFNNLRQLSMVEDQDHAKIRNCVISGNIIFSKLTSQSIFYIRSYYNDVHYFGKFSGNYYARPSDDKNQSTLDQIHSFDTYATLKTYTAPVRFEYNGTQVSKTIALDADYADAKNTKYSGSITLQPFTSVVLIKTGTTTSTSPSVSITSPAANASYASPAIVNITATASDANGTISKVDFYIGNTFVGTDNTSPYSYTWNSASAGNYTITAKATDNSGNVTTSAGVPVSIKSSSSSSSPVVSMTSPKVNATYSAPASIYMSAAASDAGGSVSKVEFYNGSTLLHAELKAPYEFTWQNVSAGNYTLTAKATDNSGNVTTSAGVPVSITSSSSFPIVSMTSPKVNATYSAPASVYMSATATDANGSVSKVDFYNGSTLLHTEYNAPYQFTWQNVKAGKYSLTAKAKDNSGNVSTSTAVNITVGSVVASRGLSGNNTLSSSITNENMLLSNELITNKDSAGLTEVSLFPNPAVDKIRIDFNKVQDKQNLNLSIQSMSGSIVKSSAVTLSGKVIAVDISTLNSGMYILTIKGSNFIINKKFIKIY